MQKRRNFLKIQEERERRERMAREIGKIEKDSNHNLIEYLKIEN